VLENEEESVLFDYVCYKAWKDYSLHVEGQKVTELNFVMNGSPASLAINQLNILGSSIYAIFNPNPVGIVIDLQFKAIGEIEDFEVLGPKGKIRDIHSAKIRPGQTALFVMREKRGVVKDQSMPGFKFKISCTGILCFEIEEGMMTQDEVDNMEEDEIIFGALLGEETDLFESEMDRRADGFECLAEMGETPKKPQLEVVQEIVEERKKPENFMAMSTTSTMLADREGRYVKSCLIIRSTCKTARS
jgi:hypothetical protein